MEPPNTSSGARRLICDAIGIGGFILGVCLVAFNDYTTGWRAAGLVMAVVSPMLPILERLTTRE